MQSLALSRNFSDFEALRPQLLGLARVILRHSRVRIDPEDLVQTVLAEILQKLQEGAEIKNPGGYASCALKNRALDEIRRFHNKYEQAWPQSTGEEGETRTWEPPDSGWTDPSLDPMLRDVLAQLEPGERCFLWRVVFEERAVQEAQGLCGWPEKSPYFHLRKLLDRIRPLIGVEPA